MRPYRGKRVDGKGWAKGSLLDYPKMLDCPDMAVIVVFERDATLTVTGTEFQVIPSTVEFNVGEFWFRVELFEKMAMQSSEYQKRLDK